MKRVIILIYMIFSICIVVKANETVNLADEHLRICEAIEKTKTLVEAYFNYRMKAQFELIEIGDFDAATNLDGDIPIIQINVKTISNYTNTQLYILLIHEMIHAVQGEVSEIKYWTNKLALYLYLEGSAVYFSSIIYPGCDEWKYINHFEEDSTSYDKFRKYEKKAIDYVNNCIREYTDSDIKKLFQYSRIIKSEMPSRIGYYLGMQILKNIEKTGVEAIRLEESEFIAEVDKYIKKTL